MSARKPQASVCLISAVYAGSVSLGFSLLLLYKPIQHNIENFRNIHFVILHQCVHIFFSIIFTLKIAIKHLEKYHKILHGRVGCDSLPKVYLLQKRPEIVCIKFNTIDEALSDMMR